MYLSVCIFVCLFDLLTVCLSVYPSIYLCVYLYVYLYVICLSICLTMCLSMCLSIYLSMCVSYYLYPSDDTASMDTVCLYVWLSIYLSTTCTPATTLPVWILSVCMSGYLSIYLLPVPQQQHCQYGYWISAELSRWACVESETYYTLPTIFQAISPMKIRTILSIKSRLLCLNALYI